MACVYKETQDSALRLDFHSILYSLSTDINDCLRCVSEQVADLCVEHPPLKIQMSLLNSCILFM